MEADFLKEDYSIICISYAFELLCDISLAFLSTLVLRAVSRCSVIHMNLRLFLACKCVCSVIYGCNRSAFLIAQLRKESFDGGAPQITDFFSHMCASINNYLSLAYTTERILATICVKTYEKQRPYFGVVCLLAMISVTVYNAARDILWRSPDAGLSYAWTTYLAIYFTNASGFACMLIVFCLRRYNFRTYKAQLKGNDGAALTERYQNSENVRTTKQLVPVIFLHSLSGFGGAVYVTTFLIWTSAESRFMQLLLLYLLNCVTYNLCQLAVL